MLQVIGAVALHGNAGGIAAQPDTQKIVEPSRLAHDAVGGIMHQYRQPQLPPADDHDAQKERQRIGPDRKDRHGAKDHPPAGDNTPQAPQV